MVEKFWPQDVQKVENVYQHRSQVCGLFLCQGSENETIYFFKEQFRIWKCI